MTHYHMTHHHMTHLHMTHHHMTLHDHTLSPLAPAPMQVLEEGVEPLVLWTAPVVGGDVGRGVAASTGGTPSTSGQLSVDPCLVKFLRPHQREGVQFMFECVAGLRMETGRGEFSHDPLQLAVAGISHGLSPAGMEAGRGEFR